MMERFSTNVSDISYYANYTMLSIKDAMANQLQGYIRYSDIYDTFDTPTSNVFLSPRMVSSMNASYITFSNINDNLESAMLNMSLSTLSQFKQTTRTLCSTFPYQQVFVYTPRTLWIPYAVALFLTFCCALAGEAAIISNGGGEESTFSTLLSRTRNESLDELATLDYRRASNLSLRYGVLARDGIAGFGLVGDFTR
jgi:hypothetical protein